MNAKFHDNQMFCIKHQKMVDMVTLTDQHDGEKSFGHLCALFAPDWGWCDGPFTVTPNPSELDLDGWEWTMSLPEPSPEELDIMNQSALELEAQFTGA